MNNNYVGVIYTGQELSNDYVSSIEEQFSKNLMLNCHYLKILVIMMELK